MQLNFQIKRTQDIAFKKSANTGAQGSKNSKGLLSA